MQEIAIRLVAEADGNVGVFGGNGGSAWEHQAPAEQVRAVRSAAGADGRFRKGHRPWPIPWRWPNWAGPARHFPAAAVRRRNGFSCAGRRPLLFVSAEPGLLNLPWELLPGRDGSFSWPMAAGRCGGPRGPICRRPRRRASPGRCGSCSWPARRSTAGLDYEREEEFILRIADRLGDQIHLEIAEAGTFDELQQLISELRPHVVHLSGTAHARRNGTGPIGRRRRSPFRRSDQDDRSQSPFRGGGGGHFAFEDERGRSDSRCAQMADGLFAGQGVRLVFFSGCQTAQAGAAGLCQTLTATGHVPIALGWGDSIADRWATEFARSFYHELAAGQPIDRAVGEARRQLLAQGRVRLGGADLLDASFALPQVYAAESVEGLVDERLARDAPPRPGVRYQLLGDNIRGFAKALWAAAACCSAPARCLCGDAHAPPLTASAAEARYPSDAPGQPLQCSRLRSRCAYCLACAWSPNWRPPASGCPQADQRTPRDGQRPQLGRPRLAVEVLNEAPILLVLDNRPPPPPPVPCRPARE